MCGLHLNILAALLAAAPPTSEGPSQPALELVSSIKVDALDGVKNGGMGELIASSDGKLLIGMRSGFVVYRRGDDYQLKRVQVFHNDINTAPFKVGTERIPGVLFLSESRVVFSPDDKWLYVAAGPDLLTFEVQAEPLPTLELAHRLQLKPIDGMTGLTCSPAGDRLYAASGKEGSIKAFKLHQGKPELLSSVKVPPPLGKEPAGLLASLCMHQKDDYLVVSDQLSWEMAMFKRLEDPPYLSETWQLPSRTRFDPYVFFVRSSETGNFVMGLTRSHFVQLYQLKKGTERLALAASLSLPLRHLPDRLEKVTFCDAATYDGSEVFVAEEETGLILRFQGDKDGKWVKTDSFKAFPNEPENSPRSTIHLEMTSDGKLLFVAATQSNNINVFKIAQ